MGFYKLMHVVSKFAALCLLYDVSGIAGLTYGILHNDEMVYTTSFGHASLENKIPCDADTSFVVGLLSKAFTGALVASLVDDGIISSWDTRLSVLFLEYYCDDIYNEAPISDLLAYRTGLVPGTRYEYPRTIYPSFLPRVEQVQPRCRRWRAVTAGAVSWGLASRVLFIQRPVPGVRGRCRCPHELDVAT